MCQNVQMKENDGSVNTGVDIAGSIGLDPLNTEIRVHLLIGNADLFSSLGMASETVGVAISK